MGATRRSEEVGPAHEGQKSARQEALQAQEEHEESSWKDRKEADGVFSHSRGGLLCILSLKEEGFFSSRKRQKTFASHREPDSQGVFILRTFLARSFPSFCDDLGVQGPW